MLAHQHRSQAVLVGGTVTLHLTRLEWNVFLAMIPVEVMMWVVFLAIRRKPRMVADTPWPDLRRPVTDRTAGRFGVKRHLPFDPTFAATAPELSPPASFDATHGLTDWGMDGNDQWGNCFWAAIAHAQICQALTGLNADGTPSYVDGFTPAQATDVVGWYRKYLAAQGEPTDPPGTGTGISDGAHFALALGLVEAIGVIPGPLTPDLVHQAIADFHGGVVLCLALDPLAQDEFQRGLPWGTESANPDYQEGHAVTGVAYGPEGDKVVTWAKVQGTTIPFDNNCVDGLVVLVTPYLKESGVDSDALIAKWDLQTEQSVQLRFPSWLERVRQEFLRIEEWLSAHHLGEDGPVTDETNTDVPSFVEAAAPEPTPEPDAPASTALLQEAERRLRELLKHVLSHPTKNALVAEIERLAKDLLLAQL